MRRRGRVWGLGDDGLVVRLDDICSVRNVLGKSQSELASLTGISLRAIQSYEQGWRPTPPHVQKLVGLLRFFEWRKDAGEPPPCWQIMGWDADLRETCPSYQLDAGSFCWLVTGNACKGRDMGTWENKLAHCMECPAMRQWLQP